MKTMKWRIQRDDVLHCFYLGRSFWRYRTDKINIFIDIINDIGVVLFLSEYFYNNMPSTIEFELSCREVADHVKRVKSAMEEEK